MAKRKKRYISKENKKGNGSAKALTPGKQYTDLYYMNAIEVGVKEICDSLTEAKPELRNCIECWEEAGVLEILIREESSIDIENLELSKEELEDEFLSSNHILCVYSVHADSSVISDVKVAFEVIVGKHGGMLCSDTPDFQPILVK